MLLAFGWTIIQTSVFPYKNVRPDEFDELEKIDHQIQEADKVLHAECRAWLEENAGNWLIWQFIEHLNNHSGLLQFSVSRNHRTSMIWPLMDFIAAQSQGSYGAVYVYDDEDGPEGAGMYKVHPDRPPVDHDVPFVYGVFWTARSQSMKTPCFPRSHPHMPLKAMRHRGDRPSISGNDQ